MAVSRSATDNAAPNAGTPGAGACGESAELARFLGSERPHILMVTNHGVHEWQITAGLPDTGGQNVYVNQLSGAFAKLGFKVTTANRGGYPHPENGSDRTGMRFRGEHERIVYLSDSSDQFIRKEDMFSQVAELGENLAGIVSQEGSAPVLIVSHYWDGGRVAEMAREKLDGAPHVWIPHSLGKLKKANTNESRWENLRIEERVAEEMELLTQIDLAVHTSRAMLRSLKEDYGYQGSIFLPPGVDTDRFDPAAVRRDTRARDLLAEKLGRSQKEIAGAPLITEISRTARTKRKDVLIAAFADVRKRVPEALLAVTIDKTSEDLYEELTGLIAEHSLEDAVAVLGSVWEYVPSLYGLSSVYCTPSVMEGFGMSIQEAAACRVPAVSTSRVPFATEYLLGDAPREEATDGGAIQIGQGAIVVPPDDVPATAEALVRLLQDDELRRQMGDAAYRITVPAFTWRQAALDLIERLEIDLPADADDGRGGDS